MRTEPLIIINCDKCNSCAGEFQLTAIACNGYDERYIDTKLESLGWTVENEEDICPDCQENSQ